MTSPATDRASQREAGEWLFIVTIFASAFCIFLIQPMVGKRILPWFGGHLRSGRFAWRFTSRHCFSATPTRTC